MNLCLRGIPVQCIALQNAPENDNNNAKFSKNDTNDESPKLYSQAVENSNLLIVPLPDEEYSVKPVTPQSKKNPENPKLKTFEKLNSKVAQHNSKQKSQRQNVPPPENSDGFQVSYRKKKKPIFVQ